MVITNTYISQLHYIVSKICDSKQPCFPEEFDELVDLTEKFETRIQNEYKKAK
mgnify:FL=1